MFRIFLEGERQFDALIYFIAFESASRLHENTDENYKVYKGLQLTVQLTSDVALKICTTAWRRTAVSGSQL